MNGLDDSRRADSLEAPSLCSSNRSICSIAEKELLDSNGAPLRAPCEVTAEQLEPRSSTAWGSSFAFSAAR